MSVRIKHVYGNTLKVAIPLTMKIRELIDGHEVEREEDFYPNPSFPVIIDLKKGGCLHSKYEATVVGNVATFVDYGKIPIGLYNVEVICRDENEEQCRYKVSAVIEIVDNTIDADIEEGVEFNSETYTLEGTVYYYAKGDKGEPGSDANVTRENIEAALNESAGKNLSTEDYTSEEKNKLSHIESGAQVNIIERVSVNGTPLTPESKSVNVPVPTSLSELSEDATHRTVSENEKSFWNGKQEPLSSGTNIKTINGNSILGSGNLNIRETYVAVRGTTTLQQIKDAFDANKFVIVYGKYMDDENVQRDACFSLTKFSYTNNSRTTAHFFAPISKYGIAEVRCTASGWSDNNYSRLQDANYITDDVASNYSQSNKFPSTKGVYDFVQQAGFITKSVDDLVNYYLKSETYTKAEVQALIGAIQQFHYEVYATKEDVTSPANNVLYLIGPTGSGSDKYEEYVYDSTKQEPWIKIGDTSIDLSGYVTTSALSTALANYTTTTDLTTLLAGKQDVINDLASIRSGASAGATAVQPAAIADMEVTSNKVTTISDQSTNAQYPSAKAVYDFVGGALSRFVEHGTADTTFMLTPNCFHIWGEVAALTLTLPSLLLPGYEFVFQFTSGATATALSLPSSLKWFTPHTVKERMLYQVRILNGCASMQGVDISLAGDPYVDLGLPSGVKWAKRNIDITRDSGFTSSDYEYDCSFFSWGNIDGHNPTSSSSFSPWDWGGANGSEPWYEGQVYGSTPGNTLTGNIPVGAEYDAARAILGSPWRMPTSSEYQELFDNTIFLDANGDVIPASTTNKLVTIEGIVGIRLASKINGNELFFPCSGYGNGTSRSNRGSGGYYWSSTWLSARYARYLFFYSGRVNPQNDYYRCGGFAVRAVQ